MKASSWLLVPCILFIGLVFCAEAKSARKRARVTTTPAPSSAPPTESTDNNSTADDEVEEYDPYYDQYDQYVEPPPPPPPPKPTGFEESFVHKVMSFAGNDDDVEEKVPPKREDAPYKHAYKWKNGRWKKYPLYLIILGGLRWDYFSEYQENLTSFSYLRKHGTVIPKVQPVFPTEDYPTWTSIATGQYPEGHNIIGDVMFNLKTRKFFKRAERNSTQDTYWWKGAQPFWSTAAKYGRRVAMFNWHDCTLQGKQLENQTDCRPYQRTKKIQPRSDIAVQFNEAFNKLYKDKYDVTVVYTDVIRRVAERHGPKSPQVYKTIHELDDLLQARLIDARSKEEQLGRKINFMVMSDYGMTSDIDLVPIYLDNYLDLSYIQYVIVGSGYAQIIPYALEQQKILNSLKEIKDGVDVYMASQLQDPPITDTRVVPDYLHYGKGEFAQDILVVTQPAFQLVVNDTNHPKILLIPGSGIPKQSKARAGINPYHVEPKYPKIEKKQRKNLPPEIKAKVKKFEDYQKHKNDMSVLALAMGPDFKEDYVLYDPIEIVDFYQIICFLLRIPTGPHSGVWDRIEGMLTISAGANLAPSTGLLFTGLILMCSGPAAVSMLLNF